MKISTIGLGYVGLSLSVLLAQKYKVCEFDIDSATVDMISSRQSPIDDPELALFKEELLDISATLDFEAAVSGSDFVVIATPTDYDDATNQPGHL